MSKFFGGLSALFLFMALATAPWPAIGASETSLTKEQISREIIGKTLIAKRMGMSVRISYRHDGTVTVKAPFTSGSGTWSYNDNGICVLMTSGPRRGKTCVKFEHLGSNRYRNSEGVAFTVRN